MSLNPQLDSYIELMKGIEDVEELDIDVEATNLQLQGNSDFYEELYTRLKAENYHNNKLGYYDVFKVNNVYIAFERDFDYIIYFEVWTKKELLEKIAVEIEKFINEGALPLYNKTVKDEDEIKVNFNKRDYLMKFFDKILDK
jgi:hypothetical protein